jgi:hypothetical protein
MIIFLDFHFQWNQLRENFFYWKLFLRGILDLEAIVANKKKNKKMKNAQVFTLYYIGAVLCIIMTNACGLTL